MLPKLSSFLAHPLTRDLDIDDPRMTDLRRRIIREKPFLRRIYQEWYTQIAREVPSGAGRVLELGSGAGFLDEVLPDVITSEVFDCSWVNLVLDGRRLPFADSSLKAVVMADVLHHIAQPRLFLSEMIRCLRPGGRLIAHEPWVTGWSKQVYTRLHHEPFRPNAETWEFPDAGPLSGANGALPWIVFARDREVFCREFPQLRIVRITPTMPFRYLVSGGVSMRTLMPGWSYGAWRAADSAALTLSRGGMAMFALVVVERAADHENLSV